MGFVDLSGNERLALLMDASRMGKDATDGQQLIVGYVDAMRRAFGARCAVQISTTGLAPGEFRVNRLLTEDGVDQVPWSAQQEVKTLEVFSSGIFGQITSRPGPKLAHDLDLSADPIFGDVLAPYHSLAAMPLVATRYGIDWYVIFSREPDGLTVRDLEELLLRANMLAAMAENLHTAMDLRAANGRIQREIDQIARIQQSLLPETIPLIHGLSIAASYATFDSAGGDLYDFLQLGKKGVPGNRWAMLIGDVSGHGAGAAVVMAMVHSMMHAYARIPEGPKEVLTYVNRQLCAKRVEGTFVTAFLAFYDPTSRKLTYSRAGHNPPIIKEFPAPSVAMYLDGAGQIPLGIEEDVEYTQETVQLRPGQTLILYTDGIVEARKPTGEFFGTEGIENSLVHCTGEPICVIGHITEALNAHQVGLRPSDDQTIVAIQVV